MSFEASSTESPAHWRTKPRVPTLIAALPYAMAAAMLSWVMAFNMRDSLGFGLSSVVYISFSAVANFSTFGIWATLVIVRVASHRAWQRIINSEFNICPCCEYPLSGLPVSARCPECGEPYQAEQVQAHWEEGLRSAATNEKALRLSPEKMQQYIRYSIWMLSIAGICVALGTADLLGNFLGGTIGGFFLLLAGYAVLAAQAALLMPGVTRIWNR